MKYIKNSVIQEKVIKLTEGRATGIPKIIRSMEKNGSPRPVFDTDEERTYFLVELHINEYFLQGAGKQKKDEAQDGEYNIKNFNSTEIKIIEYTIPGKPTSKNQKYKLSVLGLRIFSKKAI